MILDNHFNFFLSLHSSFLLSYLHCLLMALFSRLLRKVETNRRELWQAFIIISIYLQEPGFMYTVFLLYYFEKMIFAIHNDLWLHLVCKSHLLLPTQGHWSNNSSIFLLIEQGFFFFTAHKYPEITSTLKKKKSNPVTFSSAHNPLHHLLPFLCFLYGDKFLKG